MADANFEFELELDQAMEEIKGKMNGEIWQDIRAILEGEQQFIDEVSQEIARFEKRMQELSSSTLQDLLKKADSENDEEFWEALYEYRALVDTINEALIDVYQQNIDFRNWFQPVITCVLMGYEYQADLIK